MSLIYPDANEDVSCCEVKDDLTLEGTGIEVMSSTDLQDPVEQVTSSALTDELESQCALSNSICLMDTDASNLEKTDETVTSSVTNKLQSQRSMRNGISLVDANVSYQENVDKAIIEEEQMDSMKPDALYLSVLNIDPLEQVTVGTGSDEPEPQGTQINEASLLCSEKSNQTDMHSSAIVHLQSEISKHELMSESSPEIQSALTAENINEPQSQRTQSDFKRTGNFSLGDIGVRKDVNDETRSDSEVELDFSLMQENYYSLVKALDTSAEEQDSYPHDISLDISQSAGHLGISNIQRNKRESQKQVLQSKLSVSNMDLETISRTAASLALEVDALKSSQVKAESFANQEDMSMSCSKIQRKCSSNVDPNNILDSTKDFEYHELAVLLEVKQEEMSALRDLLVNKESEISTLRTSLEKEKNSRIEEHDLQAKLDSVQNLNEQYVADLEALKTENTRLVSRVSSLQNSLALERETTLSKLSDSDDMNQKCSDLTQEVSGLSSQLDLMQQELQKQTDVTDNLRSQQSYSQSVIEAKSEEITNLQQKIQLSEERLAEQVTLYNSVAQERDQFMMEMQENTTKNSDLQELCLRLRTQLGGLPCNSENNVILTEQSVCPMEEENSFSAENLSLETEHAAIKTENQSIIKCLEEASAKIEILKLEKEQITAQLQKLQDHISAAGPEMSCTSEKSEFGSMTQKKMLDVISDENNRNWKQESETETWNAQEKDKQDVQGLSIKTEGCDGKLDGADYLMETSDNKESVIETHGELDDILKEKEVVELKLRDAEDRINKESVIETHGELDDILKEKEVVELKLRDAEDRIKMLLAAKEIEVNVAGENGINVTCQEEEKMKENLHENNPGNISELDILKKSLAEAQSRNNELETTLESFVQGKVKGQLEVLQANIVQLTNSLDKKNSEVVKRVNELEDVRTELVDANATIKDLKSTVGTLEDAIESLNFDNEIIEKEKNDIASENLSLKSQISQLENNVKKRDEELVLSQETVIIKEEDASTCDMDFEEDMTKETVKYAAVGADFAKCSDELEKALVQSKTHLQMVEAELESSNQKIKENEERERILHNELNSLYRSIDQKDIELEQASQKCITLRNTLEEAENRAKALQELHVRLETDIQDKVCKFETADQTIATLCDVLFHNNEMCIENQRLSVVEHAKKLTNNLSSLHEKCCRSEAALQSACNDKIQAQEQLKKLSCEMEEKEKQFFERESDLVKSLNAKVLALEEELLQDRNILSSKTVALEEAQAEKAQIKLQVDDLNEILSQKDQYLETRLNELKDIVTEKDTQLQAAKTENDQLDNEVRKLHEVREKDGQEQKEKIKDLAKDLFSKESQLEIANAKQVQLEGQVKELQGILDKQNKEESKKIKDLTEVLAEKDMQLETVQTEIVKLEERLKGLHTKLSETEEKLESAHLSKVNLEDQVKIITKQCQDIKEDSSKEKEELLASLKEEGKLLSVTNTANELLESHSKKFQVSQDEAYRSRELIEQLNNALKEKDVQIKTALADNSQMKDKLRNLVDMGKASHKEDEDANSECDLQVRSSKLKKDSGEKISKTDENKLLKRWEDTCSTLKRSLRLSQEKVKSLEAKLKIKNESNGDGETGLKVKDGQENLPQQNEKSNEEWNELLKLNENLHEALNKMSERNEQLESQNRALSATLKYMKLNYKEQNPVAPKKASSKESSRVPPKCTLDAQFIPKLTVRVASPNIQQNTPSMNKIEMPVVKSKEHDTAVVEKSAPHQTSSSKTATKRHGNKAVSGGASVSKYSKSEEKAECKTQ